MTALRNVPASVRQRLLNRARSDRRPFNELLQYFAMERFLYRLSQSAHADRFVLKGALMLQVWRSPGIRPTMDIDLLGRTNNAGTDVVDVVAQLLDILAVDAEPDGLDFDADSIRTERITEGAEAFTQPFIDSKQIQWMAFRNRLQQDHVPASFTDIVAAMAGFLSPIVAAVSSRQPVPNHWTAPGPWT
ncbi:MAG: nucleotidyl transferase AbiEii/AbiGii toxin family protein [Spirochaetaceae bacterium]|nr:nucleotidyl transferase AbiEii/AbiGii toxin family protein [Spirochaetaceae bacterium]